MSISVSLKDFVQELQMVSDQVRIFFNQVTGEFSELGQDDITLVESNDDFSDALDWEKAVIHETQRVLNSDDYLELPGRWEINEYDMMEDFCRSFSDENLRGELLRAIKGSGAFRRFKNALARHDLDDKWNKFRDQAYKKIAIKWIKGHGFYYVEDMDVESDA